MHAGTPGQVLQMDDKALDAVTQAEATKGALEDVPGVPAEAWMRVRRTQPQGEPFTPGEALSAWPGLLRAACLYWLCWRTVGDFIPTLSCVAGC
jgi:hypothetical protein